MIINGFYKSGNNALRKACELLGVEMPINHIPYADNPGGPCIFIKRDPRNVIVSMIRFHQLPVTVANFKSVVTKFNTDTVVNEFAAYHGWLTDPNTTVIKYEDLIANDTCMKSLATILGVTYPTNAFANLEGLTFTYNAVHSDYTTFLTPDLTTWWNSIGGNVLVSAWGY
jgi:hypothetical protein